MSFIVRIIIVTVDDTDRIVKLQTIFKSESTSRITLQHPLFFHMHPYTGRNLYRLSRCNGKINRGIEIIPGRSAGCTLWEFDSVIDFLNLLCTTLVKCIFPGCFELCEAHLFKLCNSLCHLSHSPLISAFDADLIE